MVPRRVVKGVAVEVRVGLAVARVVHRPVVARVRKAENVLAVRSNSISH